MQLPVALPSADIAIVAFVPILKLLALAETLRQFAGTVDQDTVAMAVKRAGDIEFRDPVIGSRSGDLALFNGASSVLATDLLSVLGGPGCGVCNGNPRDLRRENLRQFSYRLDGSGELSSATPALRELRPIRAAPPATAPGRPRA